MSSRPSLADFQTKGKQLEEMNELFAVSTLSQAPKSIADVGR